MNEFQRLSVHAALAYSLVKNYRAHASQELKDRVLKASQDFDSDPQLSKDAGLLEFIEMLGAVEDSIEDPNEEEVVRAIIRTTDAFSVVAMEIGAEEFRPLLPRDGLTDSARAVIAQHGGGLAELVAELS